LAITSEPASLLQSRRLAVADRLKGSIRNRLKKQSYPIRDLTGIEFRILGVVVTKRKRY
jgi:hypothetical protein